MTTYSYEPLDYGKAQIRMLNLYPALDYSDPIRISLQKVTLPRSSLCAPLKSDEEANDLISENSYVENPDYIALSYVWGSPDDPGEVFVESGPEGAHIISITRNLDTALRHIRNKRGKPLVIWIDAICIDQGNLKERSHQVALMDSIYTVARSTLVWLGPEEDDSHKALKILAYLGERVTENDNGDLERHPDAPPREPGEAIWESETEPIPLTEHEVRILTTFFERPWFTRLWIRQEIALATNATVLCGRNMLAWDRFQNGASCFCQKPSGPSVTPDLARRFNRIQRVVENICDANNFYYRYEALRDKHRGVRCTDPRDAIYGVKSLISPLDQKLDVQPNYALEAADVFMDVCVRIVERRGLTHFLHTCELCTISVLSLPSWVPDWSRPMAPRMLLDPPWSASGFVSANATYLGDRALRVSGILIDKIETVRDPYNFDETDSTGSMTDIVDYIWRCYPGDSRVDSPYDEKQIMTDAYCRTFAGDKFYGSRNPPDSRYPTFDQAKEALKKIWSLEEDWTGLEDLERDTLVKMFLTVCKNFMQGRCFFTTADGYIGLAPLETQAGDIISVILGCQLPIILRKDTHSSTKPDETRWRVVGACYAHGLMCGEAIYGSLPSYYHALHHNTKGDDTICDRLCALLDSRIDDLKTDPSAVLEEFGIRPSVWSREPHRLEVSESVLRAAGVELRNFILV